MKPTCELNNEQLERIRSILNFKESIYRNLDIPSTLDFFNKRYVRPLGQHVNIQESAAIDCAAGYGWFSFAYLLAGGKRAIAVDLDGERLAAAKEIANILSVGDRIEFIHTGIQGVPFGKNAVDIFVSIETLEHIGKENTMFALQKIKDCTSKVVLLTTPNKLFPIIAHDTRIPFLHWLPANWRNIVARLFGREQMNHKNEFLSPMDFQILWQKFRPASTCLAFSTYKDYINHYPFYLPYGEDEKSRWQAKPSFAKAAYFMTASRIFRRHAYWVMPSLATIFVRR